MFIVLHHCVHACNYMYIFAEEKALEGCGYIGISLGGQGNIMVMLGKDSRTKLPEFESGCAILCV